MSKKKLGKKRAKQIRDSGTSRGYGCGIQFATNYNPTATNGCAEGVFPNGVAYPAGTTFCCNFDCLDLHDVSRGISNLDVEECPVINDPINPQHLQNRTNYINHKKNSRNIGPHYSIPLIFHDVYGGNAESQTSYCDTLSQHECECKAYHAAQILSEQYLPGNITFYRACRDGTGKILSEAECNSAGNGGGTHIPFLDVPDEFIDKNRLNSDNHTNQGWEDLGYFDNVINVYVAECLIAGGSCSNTNGFAQRGWYGDHKHRGIAIRQDTLFEKSENGMPHSFNWSTFGHELGHTFNGYHLFQDDDTLVDMSNCAEEGNYICDTEAQHKHFWSTTSNWMIQETNPYGVDDGYGLIAHRYCVFHGGDGFWDNENDVLVLTGTDPVWDLDNDGVLYGTRDINPNWFNINYGEYVIPNITPKIKAHHNCSYNGTCDSLDFHGTNVHNLLSNAVVDACRNIGCYNTSNGFCTPLPAYTLEQFISYRYDIEYGLPEQPSPEDDIIYHYDGLIGCNDPLAGNWSAGAVIHDQTTCIYGEIIYGCMDNTSCNFNAEANVHDWDCDYSCYGCNDPAACNYDINSTLNDGSCAYENDVNLISDTFTHELDFGANMVSFPLVIEDNSLESVLGNDGSIYKIVGDGVASQLINGVWMGSNMVINPYMGYQLVTNGSTSLTFSGTEIENSYSLVFGANLISFPLNQMTSIETALQEWDGAIRKVVGEGEASTYVNGLWVGSLNTFKPGKAYWLTTNQSIPNFYWGSLTNPCIEGCMDPEAINYNPDAIIDDGSCLTGYENSVGSIVYVDDFYGGNGGYCRICSVPGGSLVEQEYVGQGFLTAEDCCIAAYGGYIGDYNPIEHPECLVSSTWRGYACISTNR